MGKVDIVTTIENNVRTFDHFHDRYERQGRLRSGVAHAESDAAQIWQCLDKTSGEECSIKVMKKTETNRIKFLKEVAILKECNGHPNLLHVRNVYQCPKFYYIVTDSLNHPNVLQALESLKNNNKAKDKNGNAAAAVGPAKVAVIVAAVLNGLVYCHDPNRPSKQNKKQIVHGKVHPKNILVPNENMIGNLMLVDFTNAKMMDLDINDDLLSSEEHQHGSDSDSGDDSSSKSNDGNKKKKKKKKGKSPFHPPEYTEKTGPTAKGDMWALGVLTFLLLTGKYPFTKPSDMTLRIQNWYGIKDPLCKQFIQDLLEYNPKDRPKAKDINQKKAWFNSKAEFALYDADLGEVMYRLGTLNREHEFQVAVRSYISTTILQKSDRARLDQIFRVADVNNDNSLSRKEFEKALLKADIDFLDQDAIDSYFRILDINGDQQISYTEFMAFAEDRELLFERNRLRAAFDAFDWSKSGYITARDLKKFSQSAGGSAAFRGETVLKDSTITKMIERADKDGDGQISFDEFVDMMVGTDSAEIWTDPDECRKAHERSEMDGPVGVETNLRTLRSGKQHSWF